MAVKTDKAIKSFALEIMGAEARTRIFTELPGQRFATAIVGTQMAQKMPDKQIPAECHFTFQEAIDLALRMFVSDPELAINPDPHARVKLAGMVLYLAGTIGAIDGFNIDAAA